MQFPSEAIAQLDSLQDKLLSKVERLAEVSRDAKRNWAGLARVGGQREDHGSQLLKSVARELSDIAIFAERCKVQLDGLISDPFHQIEREPVAS